MFLHANLLHLLGNMVYLAAVGPRVESSGGPWRIGVIYLLGGLAGVGSHWFSMRGNPLAAPIVGASGAVAACLGYATVRYLAHRVPLAPRLHISVGAVGLLWLALQALGMVVRFGEAPTSGVVAYWVHIAGFVTGVILAVMFRAPREASLQAAHEALTVAAERSPAALLATADEVLRSHPRDARAWRTKADAHRDLHDVEQEIAARLRILELAAESELASAIEQLYVAGGLARLPSIRRFRLAKKLRPQAPGLAKKLLESIADSKGDSRRPEALLELAELELEQSDLEAAHRNLAILQSEFAMHDATELARRRGLIE